LKQPPAACTAKPDAGLCNGLFERFYFDSASGRCKAFDWGGCLGSVSFETLQVCEVTCKMQTK
jgi:hypothetical protein